MNLIHDCDRAKNNAKEMLVGWVLVETQLDRYEKHEHIRLRGGCASSDGGILDTPLPVLQNGRVHELVKLPDGITWLMLSLASGELIDSSGAFFKRVGWFERVWRMANRVIRTFPRLSDAQRKEVGLSCWMLFFKLPDAYRIATQLRETIRYPTWIQCFDLLNNQDLQSIRQCIRRMSALPHFNLLLLVADGTMQDAVQKTLDSLNGQIYRNFTCVVPGASDSGVKRNPEGRLSVVGLKLDLQSNVAQDHVAIWLEEFNASLAGSKAGEWVMLLRAGDVLAPHALYQFACAALDSPEAAVLYSDDDLLDESGLRCQPRFKPDWSLAHLRSTNFVGDAVAMRGAEIAKAGGVSLDCCRHGSYDLLLRVADVIQDVDKVVHIPTVLLHTQVLNPEEDKKSRQWQTEALQQHLVRNGVDAEASETLPGCRRVRYQLPDFPPLISIIVPTRDRLELIQRCLESVLEKTTYSRYEILVVDNQSAEPDVLAFLDQISKHEKVRILRYDLPFNFSAMNNMAVCEAQGEVVCLLNNDTEVISPDWLEEMVGHLLQPKVGVVGAKLYFPDGRIQHAGDLVGVGGVANHAHAFLSRDNPGYCNRAVVAQELSAVTAACLVTWRAVYQQLGGLDEKHLKVAFNDVDYCLRVREAGYRVVWTPHAELYHHESVSRGKDTSPEKKKRAKSEVAYMRKRWKKVMLNDPFYNPNLSYERPDFSLSHAPLVEKPWRD